MDSPNASSFIASSQRDELVWSALRHENSNNELWGIHIGRCLIFESGHSASRFAYRMMTFLENSADSPSKGSMTRL